jgi:DNA-binding CsgD family transcriptional regulator
MRLTPQEQAVAVLVAEDRPDKEIAEELHLSPATVRTYLERIRRKLGVRSRVGIAVYAVVNFTTLANRKNRLRMSPRLEAAPGQDRIGPQIETVAAPDPCCAALASRLTPKNEKPVPDALCIRSFASFSNPREIQR